MSIASEITRINTNIANSYTAVDNKNGTLPQVQNSANLASAIDSIEVIEQATAEGESLSLANTKAMPYSDYVVKGKSEQETRSGKNLFSGNFSQFNSTGGTGDVYAYFKLPEDNETYTLTLIAKNDFPATQNVYIGFTANGGNATNGFQWVISSSTSATRGQIFTFSTNTYRYISLYYGTSTTLKTLTDNFYIQLEKSTSYTSYEDYGASPSPDYPSEIHSVADDDINIFNAEKIENYNIKVKDNGKTIIMPVVTSGNGNTNTATKLNVLCPDLQVGDVIYIRFKRNLNNNRNKFIYLYGSNKIMYASENSPSYTITQEDLNSYVFLYGNDYDYGETEQCIITDFKIQKNTVPINYSPYNQGTVTIKQRGKNENDGINYGFYIGAEATTYRKSTGDNGICIPIRNQNYTISTKEVQARYRVACSNSLPSDTSQNCFNGVVKDGTSNNVTINTSGYKYLLVNCTNINDIQIEQGLIATPYEAYQANDFTFQTEPLKSLPNGVKDTIEADGIHRRVGRVILDGTQPLEIVNWRPTETSMGWVYPRSITNNKKQTEGVINNILCNKLKAVSYAYLFGNTVDEGINIVTQSNAYGLVIKIKDTSLTTANAINTYLSSNPITVQYELETEIIEPLTQNQATTMLDIIKTGSYEGTTNIYTDEDVKPTIGIEYYKKS